MSAAVGGAGFASTGVALNHNNNASEDFLKDKAPSAENFKQAAALAMKEKKGCQRPWTWLNFKLKLT
jgi:hypothetical protein